MSVVGVNTTGRSIVIGEELATYDKVIVLEMLENDEEGDKKDKKSDENEEREKKEDGEYESAVALGELLLSLIDDQCSASVHCCALLYYNLVECKSVHHICQQNSADLDRILPRK